MLDPAHEFCAFFGGGAGHLMGKVGADVAVDEDDLSFIESGFDAGLGFKAIAGVKHRGEARIESLQRAEVAVQKFANHSAEPRIVLRKTGSVDGETGGGESVFEKFRLSMLPAAIDAFNGDE